MGTPGRHIFTDRPDHTEEVYLSIYLSTAILKYNRYIFSVYLSIYPYVSLLIFSMNKKADKNQIFLFFYLCISLHQIIFFYLSFNVSFFITIVYYILINLKICFYISFLLFTNYAIFLVFRTYLIYIFFPLFIFIFFNEHHARIIYDSIIALNMLPTSCV